MLMSVMNRLGKRNIVNWSSKIKNIQMLLLFIQICLELLNSENQAEEKSEESKNHT
jgi:hypothetical protein